MKKTIIVLLLIFFLIVPTVSAFDFDNVRFYNKANKSMLIKNSFGLGENIAELRLNTPLNNHVPIGYNKVFEFTIKTYGNYTDALRLIEYYHAKNMSTKEVPLDLKYKSVILENVTTTTCLPAKDNFTAPKCNKVTTEVERVVWNNYISKNMIKGEITLAGFTNVKPGDYIEFIPTWFGERMYEFASWTADLNLGLVAYWDYDVGNVETTTGGMSTSNNSGNVLSNATDYMLGKSGQFDGATWFTVTNNLFDYSANDESSICFWIWYDESAGDAASQRIFSSDEATKNWDLQTQTGDNSMYFGGNMCGHLQTDPNALTDHTWDHFCATCNTTTGRWYKNGVLIKEGTGSYTIPSGDTLRVGCQGGSCSREFGGNLDEVGIWNRTITPQEAILLYNSDVGMTYDPTPTGDGSPNVNLSYPGDNFKSNIPDITFNYSCSDDSNVTNVTLYIDDVANLTTIWGTSNNTGDILTPLYFGDGDYNWTVSCYDNSSQLFEGSTFDFGVDANSPAIVLTSPIGVLSITAGDILYVNWTVSDVHLSECWYEYATTNISVACGDTNDTFSWVSPYNNLTFYSNDTYGNTANASIDWIASIEFTAETYENFTVETALEDFTINASYNSSSWSSSAIYFNYNGTIYTPTTTGTGDDIYAYYQLSIPTINETTNKTFNWLWNLTNSSGTYEITSTPHIQEVGVVTFALCNYSIDNPQLVFNTFSTTEPSTPVPATFASAWDIQDDSGGSVILNRSYEDTTEANSTWAFCIEPNNTAYTVSVDITVDATGYTPTSHYIVDTDVSTVGENISLYLLNDSEATLTQIIVRDQDNQPVQDAYTYIQRYDQGSDTYYGVGMTKSDNTGSDLAYLLWYTQWYNFVVVVDGEVELIEGPKKMSETPLILRIGDTAGNAYEKFRDIVYGLSYNNITKNFVLSFTHTSGEVSSACLRTIKRNLTNDYTICHTCESSNSATIYCNVGAWGNGTFISSFYATGSPAYWIDELYISEGNGDTLYEMIGNDNGTGMAIMLAGIIFSLFLITPALGILGAMLGMLGAVTLGFQPFDAVALIGIVIVGVAMMWAVQK